MHHSQVHQSLCDTGRESIKPIFTARCYAVRGDATVSCLSVRPSVRDVDMFLTQVEILRK